MASAKRAADGSETAQPARAARRPLPDFIEPMLARSGRPFDDERFGFEVKWDGTRALTFVEGAGVPHRMLNRRKRDIAWRYPELALLAQLPPGTVLDGEVVCLDAEGRPDFQRLQTREQVHTQRRANHSSTVCPATYVAFDLLYQHGQSVMDVPCTERRARLRALVAAANNPRLVMSEGVEGSGVSFFEGAVARGLEGVVAKRLDSRYEPGKRSGAWVKVKRQLTIPCVVIGFVPKPPDDFESLVIAAEADDGSGELRCVGRVGSGFDDRLRARIIDYLHTHRRDKPVIPCREKGLWVEPGLYCTVRCMERTADGHLRAPVLEAMADGPHER